MSAAFVVCSGGPRDGYWYSGPFWAQAVACAEFDRETATTGRTLGYVITDETMAHPRLDNTVAHVARWTGGAA